MYGLSDGITALPPMPNDGDYWSTLHSWMMPTPSFLKFIMFSRYCFTVHLSSFHGTLPFSLMLFILSEKLCRMFVDYLHSLNVNGTDPASCLLGASQLEVTLFLFIIIRILGYACDLNITTLFTSEKALLLSNPRSPCECLGLSQRKEDGLPKSCHRKYQRAAPSWW